MQVAARKCQVAGGLVVDHHVCVELLISEALLEVAVFEGRVVTVESASGDATKVPQRLDSMPSAYRNRFAPSSFIFLRIYHTLA